MGNCNAQEDAGQNRRASKISLYFCQPSAIIVLAFLRGLEKAPTFLVPIINPPFADNSPHLSPGVVLSPFRF
jgi:hypothetical protein